MVTSGAAIPDGPRTVEDLTDAIVTNDPVGVPEFPSMSLNNIHFFVCQRTVTEAEGDQIIDLYVDTGVRRFSFG